jgi:hypothetical protein
VRAVVGAFEEYPEVDVVHGDLRLWNPEENSSAVQKPPKNPEKTIWRRMPFMHPTVFVRRRAHEKHRLFDLSYRIAMDRKLMLRFMLGGAVSTISNKSLLV